MEGLFANVNRATERVLLANDYAIANAPGQRCCGALHAHAGDARRRAAARAKRTSRRSKRPAIESVCVNAAGCGAMMKEYAHLLADDPEWRDARDARVGEGARRERAAVGRRTRARRPARHGASRTTRPATCCTRSA